MIAIISNSLEKRAKETPQNLPLQLEGLLREGEDVLRILDIGDSEQYEQIHTCHSGPRAGIQKSTLDSRFHGNDSYAIDGWLTVGSGPTEAKAVLEEHSKESVPAFVLLVNPNKYQLECHYRPSPDDDLLTCEIEVIHLETDLFSRIKGIFDTTILSPKTVAIVGLGSGGSLGAVELARCGVGNFILVDFDRLWAHNIARHTCGLSDVGRFKTRAVRDMILDKNPMADVRCYEADICEDDELLEKIVAESDLIFVATDTELPKHLINEACLKHGTPAVYGGAYERAFAGEVIRVVPGETACYNCVRQNMADTIRAIERDRVFDYTDEEEDFKPEPGLGVDVGIIILLQVKMALLTLLRGSDSSLDDIEYNMIIWGNEARPGDSGLFRKPMTRHFIKVDPVPDCPICSPDNFFEEAGG